MPVLVPRRPFRQVAIQTVKRVLLQRQVRRSGRIWSDLISVTMYIFLQVALLSSAAFPGGVRRGCYEHY